MSSTTTTAPETHIALVGAGTIGLSFVALHLQSLPPTSLTIIDTRPDLPAHVSRTLKTTLPPAQHALIPSLILTPDITAVRNASIVQESGPENLPFKTALWAQVEQHAPSSALLWSSTSGIPASAQAAHMRDRTRLCVVHPYNPPAVMPLLEVCPSADTSADVVGRTMAFWRARGRAPVLVRREVPGFVANRLAFALLREAVYLVEQGVVSLEDVDRVVEGSMGPRWAVAGPFKSYHAGGGEGGLEGFFKNIGGTVQSCWDDAGSVNVGERWEEKVFQEAEQAYGRVDTAERDQITRAVLEAVRRGKEGKNA
ncbi:hypothetical protein EJ05DRAFT_478742 [Pseudovirgaria hyperparasitica]|uniref:L-gulonate 3-dehydrogenase n=1 Tax=Pseudovirgaria hyperparasitica TaxID=470096 RepID=A0A6A6W413_9PEZI|nr:uncharacterized protein EJ05DRAFT_478742 [Pseudovirgaria hyperparasitica]KAF2755781.1 hypothetical protein EJ05DRAFT_478742 [Pseudovirgaria hyperparasitica]